jgi:hypothetical protein
VSSILILRDIEDLVGSSLEEAQTKLALLGVRKSEYRIIDMDGEQRFWLASARYAFSFYMQEGIIVRAQDHKKFTSRPMV